MKVDDTIEPSVREAFAAAVAQEPERFEAALAVLAAGGDAFAGAALKLALAVDATALYNLHDGDWPDDEQVAAVAQAFSKSEQWAQVEPDVAVKFLTALAHQAPVLDVLALEDVIDTAFAVGGWLLSAYLPEDKDWTDYLDEILTGLEAAPEPT
jgi:hypothetical protein